MVISLEKIFITVKIPALENTYDFTVPNNMSVRDVQKLIIKILHSEYGISDELNEVILFDMEEHKALRLECSFAQLGIKDGVKLLMI